MRRVLVVDDSATVRQQVGLTLKQGGYEVIEAHDGLEAVQKILADIKIAMVICDVNMPGMDGLAMLEKIQTDVHRPPLPILMLTTEGRPHIMQRAKKSGSKGWIIKPFKPDILLAAVGKLVASNSLA